jgi:hypothetical protein
MLPLPLLDPPVVIVTSSELLPRYSQLGPVILRLLGKGRRVIAIIATAIRANANICFRVVAVVVVAVILVIPFLPLQLRASIASIV